MFRQIQARINQTGHSVLAQAGKYTHLTIVHLAETSIPLPGNPVEASPFLAKPPSSMTRMASMPPNSASVYAHNLLAKSFPVNGT